MYAGIANMCEGADMFFWSIPQQWGRNARRVDSRSCAKWSCRPLFSVRTAACRGDPDPRNVFERRRPCPAGSSGLRRVPARKGNGRGRERGLCQKPGALWRLRLAL